MDEITIVVIDDHPLLRQGVVDSLSLEPDLIIIGEAASGADGLQIIRQVHPQVAVVDINLPGINGLQVTQQIISEKLPTRVLLLTAYDDSEQRVSAMHSGAAAYCTKDIQPERLVEVIRSVASGYLTSGKPVADLNGEDSYTEAGYRGVAPTDAHGVEAYKPLSPREMEVLTYVSQGLSNKEIGSTLGISEQTVKNHINAIFNKIGVNDRTHAALFAIQRGWVHLGKKDTDRKGVISHGQE